MFENKNYKFMKNNQNYKDVKVKNCIIGKNKPFIIAGPCTIKEQESLINLSLKLKELGVDALRGGAFKPRTNPYSFQGLEEQGLKYLIAAKKISGLPIVTEIMNIDIINKYINDIDIIQVGSRNMTNYGLLKQLGNINKPILLKRGMSATYEEWLLAAEYILKAGNDQVILCERGIRTFEPYTRNTLDLQAIPVIKKHSHLPIIIDPSHASGKDYIVFSMSLASVAAGCDGLIIEVEEDPKSALCDKNQTIDLKTLQEILTTISKLK